MLLFSWLNYFLISHFLSNYLPGSKFPSEKFSKSHKFWFQDFHLVFLHYNFVPPYLALLQGNILTLQLVFLHYNFVPVCLKFLQGNFFPDLFSITASFPYTQSCFRVILWPYIQYFSIITLSPYIQNCSRMTGLTFSISPL